MQVAIFSSCSSCIPVLEAQSSAENAVIDSMSLVKKDQEEDAIKYLFPTTKIPNPQF